MNVLPRMLLVTGLLLCNSCWWLANVSDTDPAANLDSEKRVDDSYLNAGATTKVDIAPGQSNLLEAIREEKDKVLQLATELRKLKEESQGLHLRLATEEKEREREHAGRVAAEALHSSISEKLRDRDARILNLALEKAKLEQELLQHEITDKEKRLSELERAQGTPGRVAGPGR